MIRISNLFLRYVRQYYALYDINLEIAQGERVAFIGKKESGKTSLLRILLKLEKAQKGEVYIKNIPLKKLNFAEDINMGYLPAEPIFFENKTVYENLLYVAKMQVSRPAQIESLINDVLIDFNIEGFKEVNVSDLSLYQKYIVSLARLSLRKIDILLVDASFEALEVIERDKIIEILKQKFISEDSIFILSTEDEKLAKKLTTRQIYFENGSIVGESA